MYGGTLPHFNVTVHNERFTEAARAQSLGQNDFPPDPVIAKKAVYRVDVPGIDSRQIAAHAAHGFAKNAPSQRRFE
ncbi:MAG: hypothetical protein WBQ66_05240, partial [Blastocatellia bacterium]